MVSVDIDNYLGNKKTYIRQVFSPVHSVREIRSFIFKRFKEKKVLTGFGLNKNRVTECIEETFKSKNPCFDTFLSLLEQNTDVIFSQALEDFRTEEELAFLSEETPFHYFSLNEKQDKALEQYALCFKDKIINKPYEGMDDSLLQIIEKKEINDRIKKERKKLEEEDKEQIDIKISKLFAMELQRLSELSNR